MLPSSNFFSLFLMLEFYYYKEIFSNENIEIAVGISSYNNLFKFEDSYYSI